MDRQRGKFIVIEGPDNSGKTTQCQILTEYLNSVDIPAVSMREPGGTSLGEAIRVIVNKKRPQLIPPETQTRLFIASRRAFVTQIVIPTLEEGTCVICDRHRLSTEVYQGYVQGVSLDFINRVHGNLSSLISPDLNLVIDLSVEESVRRNGNADRINQQTIFEQQPLDFQHKVRHGYLSLARDRGLPIVNGEQSVEQVSAQIKSYVLPLFSS